MLQVLEHRGELILHKDSMIGSIRSTAILSIVHDPSQSKQILYVHTVIRLAPG